MQEPEEFEVREESGSPGTGDEFPEQEPERVPAEDVAVEEEIVADRVEVEKDLPNIIKALLFATETALTLPKIKELIRVRLDQRKILKAIEELNRRLLENREPFEVVEISGGFQFRTLQRYHPWIKQLFRDRAARRLTGAGLETLAIIAYKQPISKAEIESVRGIQTDGALKTLLERGLITISGRAEVPGRPLLYSTTRDFLRYFGLNKVADLPKLEELEEIAGSSHLFKDYKKENETQTTAPPEAVSVWQEMEQPAGAIPEPGQPAAGNGVTIEIQGARTSAPPPAGHHTEPAET